MSDHDLIKRGDELEILNDGGPVGHMIDAIAALPADPRVEKLVEALRDIADGMGETDLNEIGRYAPVIARAAIAKAGEDRG